MLFLDSIQKKSYRTVCVEDSLCVQNITGCSVVTMTMNT